MAGIGELWHWLVLLLVIGGLYVIFARDPTKTGQLFGAGVTTYSGLINATNTLGNPQ